MSLTIARAVPSWIATAIGRIAITSASLEHNQLLIAKRLLGINIAKARIVFARQASWHENALRIAVLAEMVSFDLKHDMNALMLDLQAAQKYRNLLVHSVWLTDGSKLYVQSTRGGSRFSYVRTPQRYAVDRAYINKAKAAVSKCAREIAAIAKETEALLRP